MSEMTPGQYRALADSIDAAQAWTLEYSVVEVGRVNAPHAWDCTDPDGGSFCTCWKSDPL